MTPVPPKQLGQALDYLKRGGKLYIPTYTRCTVITWRNIEAWQKVGRELLREDGNGYRMASGKKSVYLLPGQLKYGEERRAMTNTETKLQIYMPATMREQVHQAAEALRISESEWIRRAIVQSIERRAGK